MTRFSAIVKRSYPALSREERKVADFLISSGVDSFANLSLPDIAKKSGTSNSAVVRFCKKIGYSGLKEAKIAFCVKETPQGDSVEWNDDFSLIFSKVFTQSIRTLEDSYVEGLASDIENAAQMLEKARNINIIGVGGSSLVATHCATELMRLGKRVSSFTDAYTVRKVGASPMTPSFEILIAISCSGSTPCIVTTVQASKKKGVKVIALTASRESALARIADVAIYSNAHHVFCDDYHSYTRIVQMVQINAMYLMLATLMGQKDETFKASYLEETNYHKVFNF